MRVSEIYVETTACEVSTKEAVSKPIVYELMNEPLPQKMLLQRKTVVRKLPKHSKKSMFCDFLPEHFAQNTFSLSL